MKKDTTTLILDNIPDGFLLIDQELRVVYFNRVAQLEILEYLRVDVHPGMSILKLVEKERTSLVETILLDVLSGNRRVAENHWTNEKGKVVHYEFTYLPARNSGNEIDGILICAKDITEKKKAQLAIQESEERLRFALEASSQGAWDWNLQTDEVNYSESYLKMYGFEHSELTNNISEWTTRVHPDDIAKVKDAVSEHLQASDPIYDSTYRIRGKDGQYRWIKARGRLFERDQNGKPIRMIGTHADITDAVENEISLKKINERFDIMMKATHEMLWEWDIVKNRIFRTEDGIRKIYGLNNDNSIRRIEDWLQRIHPSDHSNVYRILGEILHASHQQTFEIEYRFKRDDGTYAHVYDRCILLRDENDKPVRIIGSAQDISERKRLEQELLKNELEYQRLIHQATVDSQEKERAEIGKELHDNVNQVLTTTKLYLDLALTNPELTRELISKSQKNINDVIQEIRHLSRSLMDPTIGDLGLIDSINDLIENIHLTQKLQINFAASEDLEARLCRNTKLTVFRIIQEALNNVLRHAKASHVSLELKIEGSQFFLFIRDNGIGFAVEQCKKGMGLNNIQNRVYLMNGTFQIESKKGEGCLLSLQFPIKITN